MPRQELERSFLVFGSDIASQLMVAVPIRFDLWHLIVLAAITKGTLTITHNLPNNSVNSNVRYKCPK